MSYSFEPVHKPFNHQLRIFGETVDERYRALYMEPGTGKTKETIDLAVEWYLGKEIDTVIVLAPFGVHEQWEDEQLPEHMPPDILYGCVLYEAGMPKYKKDAARKILGPQHRGMRWICIAYETYLTEECKQLVDWMLQNYKCLMVLDESSRIRNHRSKRTKELLRVSHRPRRKLLLSGTPSPRGLENLWSQMQFLSPGILQCPSFTAFKSAYCRTVKTGDTVGADDKTGKKGYAPERIVGYKHQDELFERIAPFKSEAKKRECLDLPPLIALPQRSLMPRNNELKNMYDRILEEGVAEVEASLSSTGERTAITTSILLARRTKLRQICCGFIRDNDGVDHWLSDYRLDEVMEKLEDVNEHVLLWSTFTVVREQLKARLRRSGISFVEDNAPNARPRFQAGEFQVWLGSPQRSGIGLNLTRGSLHMYYNPIDDWEIRKQSLDRADRAGQTAERVGYMDYWTPGTVEARILKDGVYKEHVNTAVLEGQWRNFLGA